MVCPRHWGLGPNGAERFGTLERLPAHLHQSVQILYALMHAYHDHFGRRCCRIAQAPGEAPRDKFEDSGQQALRKGIEHLITPAKKRGAYRTRFVDLDSCRVANVRAILAASETCAGNPRFDLNAFCDSAFVLDDR
jgi:hypothetical protein